MTAGCGDERGRLGRQRGAQRPVGGQPARGDLAAGHGGDAEVGQRRHQRGGAEQVAVHRDGVGARPCGPAAPPARCPTSLPNRRDTIAASRPSRASRARVDPAVPSGGYRSSGSQRRSGPGSPRPARRARTSSGIRWCSWPATTARPSRRCERPAPRTPPRRRRRRGLAGSGGRARPAARQAGQQREAADDADVGLRPGRSVESRKAESPA